MQPVFPSCSQERERQSKYVIAFLAFLLLSLSHQQQQHHHHHSHHHCHHHLFLIIFLLFDVNAATITKVNGTDIAPIITPSIHDLQIYGSVITIILSFIVFGGVKMLNRVAPAFLIPVMFSLFCIFMGIFLTRKDYPVCKFNICCIISVMLF